MGMLVVLTVGLAIWVIGWAFGAGGFDSFMITIALLVVAATFRLAAPFVKRQLGLD